MKTKDFERAIEALGVQGLEIEKFSYQLNGDVANVYAHIGELTYLRWDVHGRGITFDLNPNLECVVVRHPEYLDYSRDPDFDLRFD